MIDCKADECCVWALSFRALESGWCWKSNPKWYHVGSCVQLSRALNSIPNYGFLNKSICMWDIHIFLPSEVDKFRHSRLQIYAKAEASLAKYSCFTFEWFEIISWPPGKNHFFRRKHFLSRFEAKQYEFLLCERWHFASNFIADLST